jgi:hypothetical protein
MIAKRWARTGSIVARIAGGEGIRDDHWLHRAYRSRRIDDGRAPRPVRRRDPAGRRVRTAHPARRARLAGGNAATARCAPSSQRASMH